MRRFYVYLVAFASQIAMLVGINDLIDVISRTWLQSDGLLQTDFTRAMTARSFGLLLVATPLFLIHWWLAQRFRAEEAERRSVLRKLFLYGSTAAGLTVRDEARRRLRGEPRCAATVAEFDRRGGRR